MELYAVNAFHDGLDPITRRKTLGQNFIPLKEPTVIQRPTVLVTHRLPPSVERRLDLEFDARLRPKDEPLADVSIPRSAEGAHGIVIAPGSLLNADLISALPSTVRIVAAYSVGFEHIDIVAARRRGIVVTNTPDVLTDATADIAMLLLLGAARRVREADRLLREGRWKGWRPTLLLGTGLFGKRLGIVGLGRIGRAVARRALGFGFEVQYHSRTRLAIGEEHELRATFCESLDELLRGSDFLSLHCPLTNDTRGLLNRQRLALLPEGAIVVNTARGGLIEDEALLEALASGHVAAAGLDVFEGEPALNPRYLSHDHVFPLPHLGSATREARDAMGFCAIENLVAVLKEGREAPNRVN